jgi:anti-sigma factor RsiW
MNCQESTELSPRYLSRELDPARAAAFATHVGACPDCARAVELDARLRQAVLAEPLDAMDTTACDLRIRGAIARQARLRRMSMAVGIAATVILGAILYRAATYVAPVCADAAEDHRQEVVGHERRKWVAQPEQVSALASRLGMSESAPAAIDGYRLEHAKLCRLDGRIFLHAVYSDGSREFSLFLRQPDSHPSPVRITSSGGEQVAAFETAHVTAMIVADRSADAAEFARSAAAAL